MKKKILCTVLALTMVLSTATSATSQKKRKLPIVFDNENEIINPNDEIMSKDTCYLTDEEMKIRTEIIENKNRAYIEGFGYAAPSKTKTITAGSDGDINKTIGTMN